MTDTDLQVKRYTVTFELPRQTLLVWARNETQAKLLAWRMVGFAGLQEYGSIEAEESGDL